MILLVGCESETPTFQEQLDKAVMDFGYALEDIRLQQYTLGYYDCFEESDYLEQVCDRFNKDYIEMAEKRLSQQPLNSQFS